MTCRATAARLLVTACSAAVCVAVATPSLQAQTAVSLSGIRYHTGDEVNCAVGSGFALDAERRLRWAAIGVGVGIRLADAFTCAVVAPPQRYVDGEWLHEAAKLSFMGAPAASLSLGHDVAVSGAIVAPRARVGITYADTGAGVGRELLPTALLELRAGPHRLGGVVRLGAVRAPVHLRRLSAAPDGPAQTVYRDWFWRRTAELGVELRL
jgi:hypothetical protein